MIDFEKERVQGATRFVIIIVVTHSISDLELCIDSLEKINYPRDGFRVVVVDCGNFQALKDWFSDRLEKYSIPLIMITLPETEVEKPHWLDDWRMNEARNSAMKKVPGEYYIFTEDDCVIEPDWLWKFEPHLSDDIGAIGGPDYLPDGMGWLPKALECILDSRLGTLGAKRGNAPKDDWYYPRKENMLVPAAVIEKIGYFPEGIFFGSEMMMAKRIRDIGLKIKCLPDNHVWHRRDTTIGNLFKRNVYMSMEKVKLLRKKRLFFRNPHFFVLVAMIVLGAIGLSAIFSRPAAILLVLMASTYLIMVIGVAVQSLVRMKSLAVFGGVLLLMFLHHFSIACGTLYGAFSGNKELSDNS